METGKCKLQLHLHQGISFGSIKPRNQLIPHSSSLIHHGFFRSQQVDGQSRQTVLLLSSYLFFFIIHDSHCYFFLKHFLLLLYKSEQNWVSQGGVPIGNLLPSYTSKPVLPTLSSIQYKVIKILVFDFYIFIALVYSYWV